MQLLAISSVKPGFLSCTSLRCLCKDAFEGFLPKSVCTVQSDLIFNLWFFLITCPLNITDLINYFLLFGGQQIGLNLEAAIPPGLTPGINFFQSPDTIVGLSVTLAPSAK